MAATSPDPSPLLRLTFLSVVVIGLFVALLSRLWFVQILAGDRYIELADSNRLRTVFTEAPRGSVLAAGGSELVRNRPALTVSADPQVLLGLDGRPAGEEAQRVIERLAALLELDESEILDRLTSRRFSPLRPVPIAFDVAPEVVFSVREHQELLPGVITETIPVREYPNGALASHLVGYLGEVSEQELREDERYAGYARGDLVGRAGLERTYERDLRGTPGRSVLVVNAQGRVLDVQSNREALPGNDLLTTLDLELQVAVEQLLEQGIVASRDIRRPDGQLMPSVAGSAVVLDARTGAILAMASYPDYDPREFVGGVSQAYWDFVNDRENHQPLINRAVSGAYPPGSVFKTASGAAMVEAGIVGPRTQVACPSSFQVGPNTYRNWNPSSEPPMDLAVALLRSCDTYFYDLAYTQWQRERDQGDAVDEVLPRVAQRFGFGRRLGVDLPVEAAGRVPNRAWREEFWLSARTAYCTQAEASPAGSAQRELLEDLCQFGGLWRGGDAINSSIGQGDVLATPLQVASSYQAIANDGVLMRPHLGKAVLAPDGSVVREIEPEPLGDLGVDAATLAALRDGLERVVMSPAGTGSSAFAGFPLDQVPVAGKTGTAEVRPRVPFAWFAGYAPANDPEIVVAVNVEEGGGGAQTAAPIARNILAHYFGIVLADDAEFQAGDEILD